MPEIDVKPTAAETDSANDPKGKPDIDNQPPPTGADTKGERTDQKNPKQ